MVEHPKEGTREVGARHAVSLLPLIGEKEKELEAMLERTKAECEERTRIARAEAEAYIKKVKEELPQLAQEKFEAGIQQIEQEAQNIAQAFQKEVQTLQKNAEKHIEDAKKVAIKLIIPEVEKCLSQ